MLISGLQCCSVGACPGCLPIGNLPQHGLQLILTHLTSDSCCALQADQNFRQDERTCCTFAGVRLGCAHSTTASLQGLWQTPVSDIVMNLWKSTWYYAQSDCVPNTNKANYVVQLHDTSVITSGVSESALSVLEVQFACTQPCLQSFTLPCNL